MAGYLNILLIIIILLYIIFPFDAFPDFIPIAGWLDDGFLLGILLYYLRWGRWPKFLLRMWENKTYQKYNQSSYGSRPGGFKKEKTSSESNGAGYQGRTGSKDPYEILGVKPGAGMEEIRNAYRQAVKTYHPDKVSHLGPEFQELAKQKFVEIQNAYEKLTGKEV